MSRVTSREIVARVLMKTDLPMPSVIRVTGAGSSLHLSFDSLNRGIAWARELCGQYSTYEHPDGNTYLRAPSVVWHGWSVAISASRPTVDGNSAQDWEDALRELINEEGT